MVKAKEVTSTQQIRDNTKVIDTAENRSVLLSNEAYVIKIYRPSINSGLKVSKELQQIR